MIPQECPVAPRACGSKPWHGGTPPPVRVARPGGWGKRPQILKSAKDFAGWPMTVGSGVVSQKEKFLIRLGSDRETFVAATTRPAGRSSWVDASGKALWSSRTEVVLGSGQRSQKA